MDMDNCLAPEPVNMENFGSLQYIIDRLPAQEKFILEQYFVHGWTKTRIANWLPGGSIETVDRVLRNLRRIDLTGKEPMINFKDKLFVLEGLDGRNYR